MKKTIFITLMLFATSVISKQLPLEDFIKPSEFVIVSISPDGSKLAGVMELDDRDKVAVIDLKSMKALTAKEFGEERKIRNIEWASDDVVLMSVQKIEGFLDRKGKWDGVYAMKFNGKNSRAIFTRDNMFGAAVIDGLPKDKRKILIRYAGKNHYYDLKSKKATYLPKPADKYAGAPSLSKDFSPVVSIGYDIDTESSYIHYKTPAGKSWTKLDLAKGKKEVTTRFGGNSKDPEIVYILSNHDASTVGLFTLNLRSGSLKKIYRNERVDVLGRIENSDRETIGFTLMPDYPEVIWVEKDDSITQVYKGLKQAFPGQNLRIFNYTENKDKMLFSVSSDRNPGSFYLVNLSTNKISPIVEAQSWINPEDMAEMKPISLKARDGVELHGYLTLPKGKEAKNLPLVVNPHGGPHGPRDMWGFNQEIQLLANRGYAVLQINFRGSGGYGMDFQKSGYMKWGREMQDDVTDATLWAVEQGYADKDRLCIYGGSYGGYATLQGLVREPDLYKCGIGYVGVYDLMKMKTCGDIVAKQGKFGKDFLTKVHGKDKAILKANSPAFNVDKIKANVFLAHGKDDVRVPMCQLNSLTENLKNSNVKYEVMVRDEGHGYHNPENKRDFYTRMISFLDENIGK